MDKWSITINGYTYPEVVASNSWTAITRAVKTYIKNRGSAKGMNNAHIHIVRVKP